MFKIKRRGGGIGIYQSFLICFGVSAIVILLLSAIFAFIALKLEDPTGHIGIFSLISMIISAIASGVFCARLKKDGEMAFSALVALSVVLIMLLCCVIINGGRVSGGTFMNYGCYYGVFLLSAFLGKKRSGRRRHN